MKAGRTIVMTAFAAFIGILGCRMVEVSDTCQVTCEEDGVILHPTSIYAMRMAHFDKWTAVLNAAGQLESKFKDNAEVLQFAKMMRIRNDKAYTFSQRMCAEWEAVMRPGYSLYFYEQDRENERETGVVVVDSNHRIVKKQMWDSEVVGEECRQ